MNIKHILFLASFPLIQSSLRPMEQNQFLQSTKNYTDQSNLFYTNTLQPLKYVGGFGGLEYKNEQTELLSKLNAKINLIKEREERLEFSNKKIKREIKKINYSINTLSAQMQNMINMLSHLFQSNQETKNKIDESIQINHIQTHNNYAHLCDSMCHLERYISQETQKNFEQLASQQSYSGGALIKEVQQIKQILYTEKPKKTMKKQN